MLAMTGKEKFSLNLLYKRRELKAKDEIAMLPASSYAKASED